MHRLAPRGDLQAAADDVYSELLNLCVWVKANGGMGSLYRSRHELVLVYKNGRGRHRNNVELGRHGRNRTNVWEYSGGNSFGGRSTDEGNLLQLHPTVKPVQMIADALLDSTARGDIALDPFLGSGSTLSPRSAPVASVTGWISIPSTSTSPFGAGNGIRATMQSKSRAVDALTISRPPWRNIMKDDDDPDPDKYKVGYGKPPIHPRWKPGFCPNKKGRGKGAKNFQTEIKEELQTKIIFQENGKRKKITKRRLVAKQIVNKAASGDLKATAVLLNQSQGLISDHEQLAAALDTPDDKAVLAGLLERLREHPSQQSDYPSRIIRGRNIINLSPEEYRVLLRNHLPMFIERCFRRLHPQLPFQSNWHIDVIADRLNSVQAGKINRLIINLPPRHLKSISVTVAFVAMYLGLHPSRHVIAASYGQDLADKLARDCRSIMTSPFYQACFPTRLLPERKAVADFMTMQGGSRMATSVGGVLTGRGADLIVIDDPLKPDEALSETKRKAVNEWYDNSLMSRLNDKEKGAIVVTMQRLHQDDLVGHVLEQEGWSRTIAAGHR